MCQKKKASLLEGGGKLHRSDEEESLKRSQNPAKTLLYESGTNPVIPVTGIDGQWTGRGWWQSPAPLQEESSQPLKSPMSGRGASQKAAQ